jgi:hypothetical protein
MTTLAMTCFGGTGSKSGPDASPAWPPPPCTPPVACSSPLKGSHATYNVGPGQTYADMTTVPWLSLTAGDVVNIYYRATPYATKVGLRAQGTAENPVIINGVTDDSCHRPIVTGADAATATDAVSQGFFASTGGAAIEGFGVIILFKSPRDPFGWRPTFLAIQNLQIEGAIGTNTYTSSSGQKKNYPKGASGIYAVSATNFTIQNCEIKGNGEGVFVNTKNDSPQEASYYVTLRGNSIHDNGVVGSYYEHNVYVQGVRSLYEGNFIGQLIPGAEGGSLKDRSSGTVIRYNYIVAAARAIDLVDSEGGSGSVLSDPLYNYAWVYGNLIVNGPRGSGDLIHWGGDSTIYKNYHQGPLFVYFNTIVNTIDDASIFDMAMSTSIIDAHSNIITGTSNLSLCINNGAEDNQMGVVFLRDANWIQSGFKASACTLNKAGTLVSGSPQLTSNYHLPPGSRAAGFGVPFPVPPFAPTASLENLLPTYQPTTAIDGHPSYVPRPATADIGAFENPRS